MNSVLAELTSWLGGLIRGLIVALAPGIWWVARCLGRLSLFLRSGWRPLIVGFIATLLGMWMLDHFFGTTMETVLHLARTWFTLPTVLAVYTLLWLLNWAWQARQRLVVEELGLIVVSLRKRGSSH